MLNLILNNFSFSSTLEEPRRLKNIFSSAVVLSEKLVANTTQLSTRWHQGKWIRRKGNGARDQTCTLLLWREGNIILVTSFSNDTTLLIILQSLTFSHSPLITPRWIFNQKKSEKTVDRCFLFILVFAYFLISKLRFYDLPNTTNHRTTFWRDTQSDSPWKMSAQSHKLISNTKFKLRTKIVLLSMLRSEFSLEIIRKHGSSHGVKEKWHCKPNIKRSDVGVHEANVENQLVKFRNSFLVVFVFISFLQLYENICRCRSCTRV